MVVIAFTKSNSRNIELSDCKIISRYRSLTSAEINLELDAKVYGENGYFYIFEDNKRFNYARAETICGECKVYNLLNGSSLY